MKTIKKVNVNVKVIDGFLPEFEDMQENVIYLTPEYKTAVHKCLCGCGGKTITPLATYTGWSYTITEGKLTLTPSIGNYSFSCQSHYIITNGVANFV